jgi:hypothetical protein
MFVGMYFNELMIDEIHTQSDENYSSFCTTLASFQYNAGPSTHVQLLDSAVPSSQSSIFLSLAFHPNKIHIIVLLDNKMLYCINMRTKKKILLPTFTISPFCPSLSLPLSIPVPV